MCISATRWSGYLQNAEGTRRAEHPQKDFCLLLVFLKVGHTAGDDTQARRRRKTKPAAGEEARGSETPPEC
jgi:hypothetical protein